MEAPPTTFLEFIYPDTGYQLSLRKSFTKYLKGNGNKIAILKRGPRIWPVKINNDWSFGEGWEKFVQENGVEEFDFVSFEHQGNMWFETMVFDTSMSERQYPIDQVVNTEALDSNESHHSTGESVNKDRKRKSCWCRRNKKCFPIWELSIFQGHSDSIYFRALYLECSNGFRKVKWIKQKL